MCRVCASIFSRPADVCFQVSLSMKLSSRAPGGTLKLYLSDTVNLGEPRSTRLPVASLPISSQAYERESIHPHRREKLVSERCLSIAARETDVASSSLDV